MNRLIRKILKKDILKEMEEKSRENLNRGIDIAVSILKHEYPFVTGWDYKHNPEIFRSSIYLVLNADMNMASEFYNSPIRDVYKHSEAKVAYPFSPLELSTELDEDKKYELFKVIQESLVEIYDEIPSELRHEFESYASELKLPKELYIDGFVFEKPKEDINESKQKSNYLNMIKNFVESYKDRDFVCDIEVLYDEEDDYYVVTLWFDPNEIHKMYRGRDISDLRLELTRDVKNFIPLPNIYVGSGGKKGCSEKNINESKFVNDKVSLAKSLINQLFDEVSFIEQSTYNDRPSLTVYFDSDDTAANIESFFAHEICDTLRDYTGGEIKCNPSWGPEWKTNRNNPDILIDTILLEYDDEGNVLNENYSPASKEITPNKIVIHKSTPKNRDKILEQGLKVRAGECYKTYAGYGEKCIPAIFATNTTNKRAWFDSDYDDDIWEIDTTMIPEVKWYKDKHYESTKKHIVTFENIPPEVLTLKYEGTGEVDRVMNESKQKSTKDLIESVLNDLVLPQYEHVICGFELKNVDDESLGDVINYPGVTVTFIGGKGTRMWPQTSGIQKMYDDVLDDIWDTVWNYTGIALELYSKHVKDCGKENINESVREPNYLALIKTIVEIYKEEDNICDIEVSYDDEDKRYNINITFDSEELLKIRDRGGYTRQIRNKIGEEIVKYIPDFMNFYVGSYVRYCKKSVNEERYKVPSSEYNQLEKIINLEMKEKYSWWKDIQINSLEYIEFSNKHILFDAEITVDEEWAGNQWREYNPHMEFPGNKGWEDNDEYELVSLGDIIGSNLANEIREIFSETLKYTLNFEMDMMSFRNLYLIFE